MSYQNLSDNEKRRLIQQYYEKDKLSFADIAVKLGTYSNKIRRDAIRFNMNIRNKSEAQSNALNTGRHKHPTKNTTRTKETKNKIGQSVIKSWESLSDAELKRRRQQSKQIWDNLSEDEKQNRLKLANQAVREASKKGSKLEHFLLTHLIGDGYKVDFHKEQLLSNTRLQIDLFLPTMNVAIEVDGPSHFEPVWGDDALKKNKKYDQKKAGLITGKGIRLIRIKQRHDFSKARANNIYHKLYQILSEPNKNNKLTIEIED